MKTPDYGRIIQQDCANHASDLLMQGEAIARQEAKEDAYVNKVTEALRSIPDHQLTPRMAAILIATLAAKINSQYWRTDDKAESAVECLDIAHDDLEYVKD